MNPFIATLLIIILLSAGLLIVDLILALIIAYLVALHIQKHRGEPLQEDVAETWRALPLSRLHRQVRRAALWWLFLARFIRGLIKKIQNKLDSRR